VATSVVLGRNLNPYILVVQPTQNWYGCDGAGLLRAPKIGRILFQGEMRADLVVIGKRNSAERNATVLRRTRPGDRGIRAESSR
jgi:hypothetical protein